jgi:energy-coupling factor transporter ATP-binding protein EcfA2
MKLSKNLQFYDAVYSEDFPMQQAYLFLFNRFPSIYSNNKEYYDYKIIDYLKNNNFILYNEINIDKKNYHTTHELIYVNHEFKIIILVNLSTEKKEKLILLQFFYDISEFKTQFDIILENCFKFQTKKRKLNIELVKTEMGELETEEYEIKTPDIDLELNYGIEFLKVHDVIVKRLNTNFDKGIVLLHGEPGTGKTFYLRYLTKLIKDKEILFVPPSMASILSDPSIIPFLITKKNSILIIEDGEKVIKDRELNGESAASVSNLLNLTDGILGDCLNIQVIITFNVKREKIDEALLRKSRLICEWKFDLLNVEHSNKLLKKLFPDKNYITNKSLPLSDIYTFNIENFAITNNQTEIGFK